MPLMFNSVLESAGLTLADVRLLRHKDKRAAKGRSPYDLWRDSPAKLNEYQSTQSFENEAKLNARYWASFVGTPAGENLFVGLFRPTNCRPLEFDRPRPYMDGVDVAGSVNMYDIELDDRLGEFIGRLVIEWGDGALAWIQRADNQNKRIVEVRREFKEPEFPGYLSFIESLSRLESLPQSWITVLQSSRGVYLLTCPRTKEQYVGAAYGELAFWGRWQRYILTGHGDNVALKSRDPSDYQVSILEVAGSAATTDDILHMERLWKAKLQSQEMGLNRN